MAILIGVVTLAVLPNIAKSKESKDITALDSILSATNNAVASRQVATNGDFTAGISSNKADISSATPTGTDADKVRDEVVKLLGKNEIQFNSTPACATGNQLKCSWTLTGGTIEIKVAIINGSNPVAGDYMGNFEVKN